MTDRVVGNRKIDRHGGSEAGRGTDMDDTLMSRNRAVHHRKPQAGSAVTALGCEKGLEDSRQMFGRDAVTGVGNLDAGIAGGPIDLARPNLGAIRGSALQFAWIGMAERNAHFAVAGANGIARIGAKIDD